MAISLVRAGKFSTVDMGIAGAWVPIAEVYDIGALATSREVYDITSHGATLYRNVIPGLYNTSTITLGCNYTSDGYFTLWDTFTTNWNQKQWFRVLVPLVDPEFNDKEHNFEAFITEISPEFALDDRLVFMFTVTVDGLVSFAGKTVSPPS